MDVEPPPIITYYEFGDGDSRTAQVAGPRLGDSVQDNSNGIVVESSFSVGRKQASHTPLPSLILQLPRDLLF